jgi:hypothetical protein
VIPSLGFTQGPVRVEQQVTLEEFDFTASSKPPAAQIRDRGAPRFTRASRSSSSARSASARPTSPRPSATSPAARAPTSASPRPAASSPTSPAVTRTAPAKNGSANSSDRPDVLILDDFALRQLSAAQADDLHELVSERQGRSLIITSDRAPSDWYPLIPNPVVAESLLDRLINTSHQVILNGPSYCPNKPAKEPY